MEITTWTRTTTTNTDILPQPYTARRSILNRESVRWRVHVGVRVCASLLLPPTLQQHLTIVAPTTSTKTAWPLRGPSPMPLPPPTKPQLSVHMGKLEATRQKLFFCTVCTSCLCRSSSSSTHALCCVLLQLVGEASCIDQGNRSFRKTLAKDACVTPLPLPRPSEVIPLPAS